jgi:hypothetical protein
MSIFVVDQTQIELLTDSPNKMVMKDIVEAQCASRFRSELVLKHVQSNLRKRVWILTKRDDHVQSLRMLLERHSIKCGTVKDQKEPQESIIISTLQDYQLITKKKWLDVVIFTVLVSPDILIRQMGKIPEIYYLFDKHPLLEEYRKTLEKWSRENEREVIVL